MPVPRIPTALRLVAGLAVVLTPLACSTDQDLGAPVARDLPPVDACALLDPTEIAQVTGWSVPDGVDDSERLEGDEVSVCSFSEPNHAGIIQVQVDEDEGRPEFDRRRQEMESTGMAGRDASVAGAEAAYDAPTHGVVGMLVDDAFVQVVTIGPGVDDTHHLELAAIVAGNLS